MPKKSKEPITRRPRYKERAYKPPEEPIRDSAGWQVREFCRRIGLDYDETRANTPHPRIKWS